jgi:PAS domain S-box-containing protein
MIEKGEAFVNYKMIMTSPYPETTEIIRRLSSELGYPVTIVEDTMGGAANKIIDLVSKDSYEVIISRAGTAQVITEMVDLPIVHCDNSDFDILQAFLRAKTKGDKVGFLNYPDEAFPYKLDVLLELAGFDVVLLPYRNWDEITKQIQVAFEMGLQVLVGGGYRAHALISQYGMEGMYISTNERTIKRALIRAAEVAQYRIAAREKAERLNAVIHVSDEAILLVNKDGQIETFNPAAEKLFGIDASIIIGNYCKKTVHPKLHFLLNRDEIFNSGRGSMTTEDLIVTYETIQVGSERVGTVITCKEITKIQQLENQIRRELHSKGLLARFTFSNIKYESKKVGEIIQRAHIFARTDSTVLITGESGTGKELFAQGIHNASKRKDGPFVAINCAALPESLLESELFGYADGAFTGARKGGRPGVFELAHGGTIFLDEIGEISPSIQGRLLRVIQEREVMRVGGDRIIPVDIRIIAATNQNLWNLVKKGTFRSDLFFRISVLRLEVPPLRNRKEDISIIVNNLLEKAAPSLNWDGLSKEMKHFFLSYSWPGNIRQLENVVERFQLSVKSHLDEEAFIQSVIRETEMEQEITDEWTTFSTDQIAVNIGTLEDMEKQIIHQMLNRFNQNRTSVADNLGISRTTLWKKINTNQ